MAESIQQRTNGYGKRLLWQWIVIYLIIGIIIYGLIYYFVYAKKGGYSYNQTGNQYQNTQSSQQTAPSSTTSMQEITVVGNEFAFAPATITAKKGQSVKITFKNAGKYPHNITFADLNTQSKTIQPGDQDTITITLDKVGTFTYTCTVPGHADKGMKGTLTVQ